MKVKNIKFANKLKHMIYRTFILTKSIDDNLKYSDTSILEKEFEKIFLEGKNIDNVKDQPIIEFKSNNTYKKISIRDLFINLGNRLVKEDKILEFIELNKNNIKKQLRSYKKFGIGNIEAENFEKRLFELHVFNELFGIKYNQKEMQQKLFDIKLNGKKIDIKKLQKNFRKVIYEFVEEYHEILQYSSNPWTDITLKDIDKISLNIITDARFKSEIEAVNKNNIKNIKILLIKTKKGKLDGYDIHDKLIPQYYNFYKKSKTIENFEKSISHIANQSEKLSILLTLHEYLKIKKNEKYLINQNLEKDIKKNIGNYEVIFNEHGNLENLRKEAINIAQKAKNENVNLITLIANRKTGKDTFLKFIKEYIEQENILKNEQSSELS